MAMILWCHIIAWLMKDEIERPRKEAAVACSRLLFRNSPGGTDKNNEVFSQDSRSRGKGLKLEPPEYETKLLASRPHMLLEIPYRKFVICRLVSSMM